MNRKIIITFPLDGEFGLLQELDDTGAVGYASGNHLVTDRTINCGHCRFTVFAESFWNLHRAPSGRIVGAAEIMTDVYHPFPRIKYVVVLTVVINGEFLTGMQFGFDDGNMIVGTNFSGRRMFLIRVPDD